MTPVEKITTSKGLKDAILQLEQEQIVQGTLLKSEVFRTYEKFKPVNIFRKTLSEVATSPHLVENLVLGILGLSTGYLSRKLIFSTSDGPVKKIFGSILQFGITKLVTSNPNAIKSLSHFLSQVFRKKHAGEHKI
jgi:hypothetical protein